MNSKDAEPETPQWDFEKSVAQTVKLQIKLLLRYVDKTVKNKEEKRNRYLLPLKYLFCYAEKSGLQDILKMEMAQEEEFASLLRMHIAELNINSKSFIAFCRKTLFLEAKGINWEATVTNLNLGTIRIKQTYIKEFLKHLEEKKKAITVIDVSLVKEYFDKLSMQRIGPQSYNNKVRAVTIFLQYLQVKDYINHFTIPVFFYKNKS